MEYMDYHKLISDLSKSDVSLQYKYATIERGFEVLELKIRLHGFINLFVNQGYSNIHGLIVTQHAPNELGIFKTIVTILNELNVSYTKRYRDRTALFTFAGGETLRLEHVPIKPILTKAGKPYKKPRFKVDDYSKDSLHGREFCFVHYYDFDKKLLTMRLSPPKNFPFDLN